MSRINHLDISNNKIWKDRNVPKEAKYIYSYIYSKGFERLITDINIGEIQQVINIKNKGLRKNLETLAKLNYLIYQEYTNGMYTITLN